MFQSKLAKNNPNEFFIKKVYINNMDNSYFSFLSLQQYYNKKELESLSASWIDLYSSFFDDKELCNLFEKVFNEKASYFQINGCAKDVAEQLMVNYYHNEAFIKSELINRLKKTSAISFFELPVNNSRVDVCSINGHSCAYEIKTKYDSLKRLEKQLSDYLSAFEYVYVVCPLEKMNSVALLLPDCVGLYVYDNSKSKILFKLVKKAKKSIYINPLVQFSVLRQSEREMVRGALNNPHKMNKHFKDCLKNRYKNKWDSFCEHQKDLNRLDYQHFFSLV